MSYYNSFEVGNTVYLKCGSPPMVIEKTHLDTATCLWVSYDSEELRREDIDFKALTLSVASGWAKPYSQ